MQVKTITAEEYADIVKFMHTKCARLCSNSESSKEFYTRYNNLMEGALSHAVKEQDMSFYSLVGKLAVCHLSDANIKPYCVMQVDEGTSTYYWCLARPYNYPIVVASHKILAVIV